MDTRAVRVLVQAAVRAEREECARVAEMVQGVVEGFASRAVAATIADEIRSRRLLIVDLGSGESIEVRE